MQSREPIARSCLSVASFVVALGWAAGCGIQISGSSTSVLADAGADAPSNVALADAEVRDGATEDAPAPTPELDATVAPLASCKAIKAADPSAKDGLYRIDPDGSGVGAPFTVRCEMTTAGGGWTLVGRELPGSGSATKAGPLQFLDADTKNPDALAGGTESGILGARMNGLYTDVWLAWDTAKFIRFTRDPGFDIFGGKVDTSSPVTNYSSSEALLNGFVAASANKAAFCLAAKSPDVRPGDTSWAVKPDNDANDDCGCNSMGWAGKGAFYGGASTGDQTACNAQGGAWAGPKDNGTPKGGITAVTELRLWVR